MSNDRAARRRAARAKPLDEGARAYLKAVWDLASILLENLGPLTEEQLLTLGDEVARSNTAPTWFVEAREHLGIAAVARSEGNDEPVEEFLEAIRNVLAERS